MVSALLVAALALPAAAAELPAGVVAVPLSRGQKLDAYYAQFQVGTPPQTEYLKIDTGSPRYSFLDPRNSVCMQASKPCSEFGTFDNTTSSTCHYERPGFQDALGPVGSGDFLSDTFVLGGVTMPNMTFGYTSRYSFPDRELAPVASILGLSLECGYSGEPCEYDGRYILAQMKNASIINTMATSIYLGPDEVNGTNAKMLMGGAYDKAKVDGELFTLDMVDPLNAVLTGSQTNNVNVTAMEVVIEGGNRTRQTFGEENIGVTTLLDTGVASWYLSNTIFQPVFRALGQSGQPDYSLHSQPIDCAYRDPSNVKGHISVEFGTAGKVQIPLHSLVTKFPDGTCGTFILPRDDTVGTLGDPFLRGVYTIFDQENLTISIGKVRHTDKEEIVPFPEGGFKASSKRN